MSALGSLAAITSSPPATPAWPSSIQLRRRPSQRVSIGRRIRSITGAQITFTENMIPAQEKKPIVVALTPSSRSQADRVAKINRNGSPAEKPRNSIPATRGCR